MLFDNGGKNMKISEVLSWNSRDSSGKAYNSLKESVEYNENALEYFKRPKLADYIAKIYQGLIPYNSIVIDSAAGTGMITKALVSKGFNVISFDISSYQLDFLKKSISEATTILHDINSPISCKDESVSGVIQVGANRFMTPEGQELFIKEALRVLKENGVFIYPVFFGEIFSSKRIQGFNHKSFTFKISKLIEKCGFEVLETPTLIHGKFWVATCTLIIAQKKVNPKQRSFGKVLKKSMNIKIL